MPFAVFRRHQRKLLAIFAILAMFGFVVADSLPRLLSGGYAAGGNPTVVEIYGRRIRRSDIKAMADQRNNANLFMFELTGVLLRRPAPQVFGELSTKSLVDAFILEHEADRLGMRASPEVARNWLKRLFGTAMTRELFEQLLARFNKQVSGEQLLYDIANQLRISNVQKLIGPPQITPFDIFQTYRDQNERVSVRAVGFPVEDFVSKVGEPTSAELQAYYAKYKDVLPDPNRPTPGFKVPRRIQVEVLSLDGEALLRTFKDKLTESELLSYYENRKAEFKKPSELPDDVFQDAPELTPPQFQAFADVRPFLATSLGEEKAQAEIVNKFGRIKDEVMIPFADKYLAAAEDIAESEKAKRKPMATLPKLETLEDMATKEGLSYELSPLLTQDQAAQYGLVSGAEVGLTRFSGGRKFVEELFETKSTLFEPIELTDATGRRFLVRKVEDQPPRVPSLDQIRPQVIAAWKTEKARPLAKKAAEAYAEKAKAAGGKIEGEIVDGHPVITTDPITKLQPGMPVPGQYFETGPPTPTEIPQLSGTGPVLRDAYFSLTEGAVEVAPNQPESIYYVLALSRRFPASFSVLYSPNGDYYRYRAETQTDAMKKRELEWMNELRAQAGLKPDWTPMDEAKNKDEDRNG
jgi:peptidyl-prolyl cis-trans isomerase D